MSIDKVRKLTDNKGCQAVMIGTMVLIIAGMVLGPGLGSFGQNPNNPTLFKLNGKDVTANDFEQSMRRNEQLLREADPTGQRAIGSANEQLSLYGRTMSEKVDAAAVGILVSRLGSEPSDEALVGGTEKLFRDQVTMMRSQMIATGMLKPNATDAEFEAMFRQQIGGSPDEVIKREVDRLRTQLADPNQRAQALPAAQVAYLQRAYIDKAVVSEADVRADFDELQFSVLRFDDATQSLTDRQSAAEKALADVRGGKSLAEAQKAHAPKGKVTSETLPRRLLNLQPQLAALGKLKDKEFSDVISIGGVPVIYQATGVKSTLPKDFEQQKTQLIAQRKEQQGRETFQKEITAARKGIKVESSEPIWALLARFTQLQQDMDLRLNPAEQRKSSLALLEEVKAIDPAKAGASRLVNLLRWGLTEDVYSSGTPEEQKAMVAERIEATEALLVDVEDNELRTQLVEFLYQQQEFEKGAELLLVAATNNADFGPPGQQVYGRLRSLADAQQKAGKLDADAYRQVDEALGKWLTDKAANDREQRKLEEEARKAQEELDREARAAEAEAKKQETQGGNATGATGSTPPAGGAANPNAGNPLGGATVPSTPGGN